MRKLFLFLALLLCGFIPRVALTQEVSRGYFAVNDCGTIFGPTPFRIVCLQLEDAEGRTHGNEYQWTGSAWVQYNGTGGSGGTALLTTFTPAGNLSSINVQAALQELDTEKLAVGGTAALATALAANGTNCGAGEASAGVDVSGNAEGCFTPGGTAAAPALDLGDNSSNESAGLALIATTGDTNSVVTVPSANKMLIDMTKRWPGADTATLAAAATALAADGSDCSAGQFPRGIDASGNATNCTALPTTLAGTANQITVSASTGAITISIPNNPTLPGTTTGTFSGTLTGNVTGALNGNANTATALAADPANCGAGNAPLGIDANGTAQGCFDVATQAELDTHTTSTSAHSATASNTANRIVLRDGSGNFSAGTITANFTGTLTGNAATATLATTATTANALADAGWIPPVVTVATLPSAPTDGQEVTVTNGLSANSCEIAGGTSRTRCGWNASSGHWEPVISPGGSSSVSLQTAKDAGATINNSVDLSTAVKIGNGTIFHCFYADSSNVLQQAACDSLGTLIAIDKITKADANKIVEIQDSSGTPVFTVTDTAGVGAITAAKGLPGGFSIPYTGTGAAGAIQDADDFPKIARIPFAQHVTKICGTTDTGTTTFNLQRNDGSPVNIAASNIIAATSEVCTTTLTAGEDALAEGHYIDLVIVTGATSGTPTRLTIGVTTKRD